MCRVLGVSRSGFYAWHRRRPSTRAQADAALTQTIRTIHADSRKTYGAPRVHAELQAAGVRTSRKRVARRMRQAGLVGTHRRRFRRPVKREQTGRPAPDLVERDFTSSRPDALWVGDITHVSTQAGTLYLAVVIDAFSRRVVGWAMRSRETTALVTAAVDMAVQHRQAAGVIHHSDQGVQYTATAFMQHCHQHRIRVSMGSVGDCYDNAMCESFFATLECECLRRTRWQTHTEARRDLFTYIEGFYNRRRIHSALGYRSPMTYERMHSPSLNGGR